MQMTETPDATPRRVPHHWLKLLFGMPMSLHVLAVPDFPGCQNNAAVMLNEEADLAALHRENNPLPATTTKSALSALVPTIPVMTYHWMKYTRARQVFA